MNNSIPRVINCIINAYLVLIFCIYRLVGRGGRREVGGGSSGGSEAALAADRKRGCGGRSPPPRRAGGAFIYCNIKSDTSSCVIFKVV